MSEIKRIPYGVSDFQSIQRENQYYVDKTMFIPKIERTNFVFLIRPRRFGKSLLLTMLQYYYDIRYRDKFPEIFHDTWIFENETKNRGQYLCLYFNFSAVSKTIDDLEENFNTYCNQVINHFVEIYRDYIPEKSAEIVKSYTKLPDKLNALSIQLSTVEQKVYIFIDEYDNFTNTLIADLKTDDYHKITHGTGFYRDFFTQLKACTSGVGACLERLFITGVSPITMDDLTSGFNIGNNISLDIDYNNILGFTEKDVKNMIDYYYNALQINIDKIKCFEILKIWYDDYRFTENATNTIFNSDGVIYFIDNLIRTNAFPTYLIDDNLKMDYKKLHYLVIQDQKLNGNFNILNKIIDNNGITSFVKKSFPIKEIKQAENFNTLLYFLGLLTFSGETKNDIPYLKIPNESIRRMIYEYIKKSFETAMGFNIKIDQFSTLISDMAFKGDFKPAIQFIANEIKNQTKIRDYTTGENLIKIYYLVYLYFIDYYTPATEEEMNKGFADLVLKPNTFKFPNMKYAYMIEFKYLKATDSDKEINSILKNAKQQMKKYIMNENTKKLMNLEPNGKIILKKIVVIFKTWEMVACDEGEA